MLSKNVVFVIMSVTGPADKPTWEKVGKGRKSEAKALAKAESLAKDTPGARFYVMRTVKGFAKRPEVCSKTYKPACTA